MTIADHTGEDLRRRSFVGADLEGASFSGADVRGVDFSGALLRNGDFTGARVGLVAWAVTALLVAALLIVAATGWVIGWTLRDLVVGLSSTRWDDVLGRVTGMVVIGFFLVSVVAFGLHRAARYGAIALAVGFGINYIVVALSSRQFEFDRDGQVVGVVMLVIASTVSVGIARVVGGSLATWAVIIVAFTGGFTAGRAGGAAAGFVVGVLLVVFANRELRHDHKDLRTRRLVHQIVCRRGTRFTDADLRGVDFSGTRLAQCDLTGAQTAGARLDDVVGGRPFSASD